MLVIGKLVYSGRKTPTAVRPDPPTFVKTKDPTNKVQTSKDGKPLAVLDLQQTDACTKSKKDMESAQISSALYKKLARGQSVPLFSLESDECIRRNKVYAAEVVRRDAKSNMLFYREKIGDVRVIDLKLVPYTLLQKEMKDLDRFQITTIIKRFKAIIARRNSENPGDERQVLFNSQVLVTRVRLEDRKLALPTYVAPMNHPMAKTISAQAGRTSLSGFTIYDARPPKHFKIGAIPGAINLAPGDESIMNRAVLPPEFLMRKTASPDLNILPKAKDARIVVYSNGPYDFLGYNAVSLIAINGYTDISWIRGGWDEWKGASFNVSIPSQITPVDMPQALTLLQQKARFVDARSAKEFARASVPGSVLLSVNADLDERGQHRYKPPTLTYEGLLSNKETLEKVPNFPKDQAIVIYGRSEYDVRAVKVALLLNHLGYRKTYILKGGYLGWLHYNQLIPTDYPLNFERNRGRGKKSAGG